MVSRMAIIRKKRMFDPIEEAIYDLMQGKVVIVCDDEDRENEGDFIAISRKNNT